MVLKTRGLGTGATFMRGSYVAEPRLLAWLRERTVLVTSEHGLHAIYSKCLKLIFGFATQSSLFAVAETDKATIRGYVHCVQSSTKANY